MKAKKKASESFDELERLAHDPNDIHPMSAAMRRQWNAARKTPSRVRVGRPPKAADLKSKIVPISIDPKLLGEIDAYAKAAGLSRSRLVAEGLRLRMNAAK